jgi:16S rRNA (cytosine1402-N4)-methyltransferase
MLYHKPVLLQETIDALKIRPDGRYVDLTFGGGGHAMAILEHVTEGKLYAFDQDADAEEKAARIGSKTFQFVRGNFRHFDKYLKMLGVGQVDGILADLGVSSHQIDTPERGFSTRYDARLDMRMDATTGKSARSILNKSTEAELQEIFSRFGEVRNARTLAQAIVEARTSAPVNTIQELKNILDRYTQRGKEFRYYAQVFQALRIAVNDEMEALKEMLVKAERFLKPGGRLAVISYHSLEDRLVKNFINKGQFEGEPEKDVFGNVFKPLEAVTRKPVVPSDEEIANNNRARSAKLRVAIKVADHG